MRVFARKQIASDRVAGRFQYYLPALIVIIAVAICFIYGDQQKRKTQNEALRASVTEHLRLIQTKLAGNINSSILLVKGMVATIATEPDITEEKFSNIARRIFETPSQLRSVAMAPDLVVRHIYPLAPNLAGIGKDFRKKPDQIEAVLRARDTGQMVITGPVLNNSGVETLMARYPVSVENAKGGRTFWGIVTAVVDLKQLYHDSGLESPDLPIRISINAVSGGVVKQPAFYGDAQATADDPVVLPVNFGAETWLLSAVPRDGWHVDEPNLWGFRFVMMALAMMIIAPVIWVARLLDERQENISVLRQREEELRGLSHRHEIALDASRIGVWELDVASGALFVDRRMEQLYGLTRKGQMNTISNWAERLHPDDRQKTEDALALSLSSGQDYTMEFRIIGSAGEIRHIRAYGTLYRDSNFCKKMVGVNWDISPDVQLQQALEEAKHQTESQNQQLEEARRRLEHESLHDALTGLPNRRFLDQYLADIDAISGTFEALTLLHIDLDRFKEINDTLGHAAGDAMLRHAAQSLRQNIRASDFAARIGGDEFVVICRDPAHPQIATNFAHRLIEALNAPTFFENQECRVGASIGIASRRNPGEPAEQLLVHADIALYEAKRRGRNRVETYTEQLKFVAVDQKRNADDVLRAVEQRSFVAYYQPQFCARTLKIVGVEALARWRHPSKGLLGPDKFLGIAQDLGVLAEVDAAILEQALFQHARWQALDLAIPRVSVNISAQRLFDERLENHLRELTILPGSLAFELLESISFDDSDDVDAHIDFIRRLGIDIEIDDFGTGYASILSLLKLSPRRLKIDRQLIMPILDSLPQRRLISSIVDIGSSLGIEIVAEGVETMQHVEILRDLGCHTLQGYALARPMDGEDLVRFARDWMPDSWRRSA